MFNRDTAVPGKGADGTWPMRSETPDCVNSNGEANRILFGMLSSEEQEAYRLQEENHKAGIPDAPSVETDESSWDRYTSALYEERKGWTRNPIGTSENLLHQENDPPGVNLDLNPVGCGRSRVELESYALQLNRTRLLFIPTLDHDLTSTPGTVVQVCVRSAHGDGDMSEIFSINKAIITRTIETLLVGHVNMLHKLPKCVTLKEIVSGYDLTGVSKPWKYGHGKKFCLGDIVLQPAKDKWVFYFEEAK